MHMKQRLNRPKEHNFQNSKSKITTGVGCYLNIKFDEETKNIRYASKKIYRKLGKT
jgi:hypothetical protein